VTRSPSPIGTSRQLRLDLGKTPSHERADFIVSACNRDAVAQVDAWPNWPGGRLALIGPAGSGKTHLARAWKARVGAQSPDIDGGESLSGNPILIEDADRRGADELIFHLFNMADVGASLLLTGRAPPAAWRARLPDLPSRLKALTVAVIGPPDDTVLFGVMMKLFSERNIRPTAGVPTYIMRRIERSVPAVQNVVRRIDECAGAEKREVTLTLARQILEDDDQILDGRR